MSFRFIISFPSLSAALIAKGHCSLRDEYQNRDAQNLEFSSSQWQDGFSFFFSLYPIILSDDANLQKPSFPRMLTMSVACYFLALICLTHITHLGIFFCFILIFFFYLVEKQTFLCPLLFFYLIIGVIWLVPSITGVRTRATISAATPGQRSSARAARP